MKPRVLFILLDAADADLIEKFCSQGLLPTFEKFVQGNGYTRLDSLEHSLAECVQVSFFTGNHPNQHGFHGQHDFNPKQYTTSMNLQSGFDRIPPFYDLGNEIDILTFDLPLCPILQNRSYVQIIDWGCHGFAVGGRSHPEGVWEDLIEGVGLHPEHGIDFALLKSSDSCRALYQRQIKGIKLRSQATRYLLDKYPWQLALTATSETHTGVHYLMRHPGNESFYQTLDREDPIIEIYQQTDRYVADLIAHVGNDTEVLLASVEGMSPNHAEVPNIAFLPEMLFRYSFLEKKTFDYDQTLSDLPQGTPEEVKANWVVHTSRFANQPGKFQQILRNYFSEHTTTRIEQLLNLEAAPFPPESRPVMNYQPAVWLEPYWPHMRAFALPTFSDGFIRLNVKERESKGEISQKQFLTETSRICEALESYLSSQTGKPGIDRIERVRDSANSNPEATPADLIVFWKEHPMGKLTSAQYGNVGPLPPLRAAVHNTNAFVMGCGPRLSRVGLKEKGHIFDIAATVHDLLGVSSQSSIVGNSLLAA